ncbi:MAG: zinc ribbon domain-containing protein [Deltaproteobacteria bacterium]|nr:zinc ribbon domain-containing protein [Deltaproteobacteria bacterium]
MPMYEYECEKCGLFEVSQRITEDALTRHTCGAPAHRVISRTAFALKGSGWYADGYGASNTSSGQSSKSNNEGGSSSGSSSSTSSSGSTSSSSEAPAASRSSATSAPGSASSGSKKAEAA